MKALIIMILTVALSTQMVFANRQLCEWLGKAANAIAQNRDNGIDELELLEHYLKHGHSYHEQTIIVPLIDRVYGIENQMPSEQIAIVEQQHCMLSAAGYGRNLRK